MASNKWVFYFTRELKNQIGYSNIVLIDSLNIDLSTLNNLLRLRRRLVLFTPSSATNFTFKIKGNVLSQSEISQINNINTTSKIRDRINAIYAKGCHIVLDNDFDNHVFKNNLILIDSLLPEILSNALIAFYKDGIVKLSAISNKLTLDNPLKYNQSLNHKFYEHKLKRFLSEVALGMMPGTTWTGLYDGTEGYLVIKEDGDIVCYHIINRNLFEDYLLENTKFETPSTTRHGFGAIFTKNNELFIKLNLQIRFL